MPETPDYTAWPKHADVLWNLGSAGVTARDPTRIDRILSAVVQEVTHRTRRQFVADSVASARLYDGSGTVEQEVDEFVSLASMQILGYVGVASAITVTNPVVCQDQTLPQTRILLYTGTTPIYAGIYIDKWPQGYRNIQATCTWGYGTSIPADLWEAVAAQAAAMVAMEAQSGPRGMLDELREGDVMKKFQGFGTKDNPVWTKQFLRAIYDYKRPAGNRLRHLRPAMI